MVENFYFWYCVENLFVCHEFNDAIDLVTDLDADIPQEGASCPSSHDNDFYGYTSARYISMANLDQMEWVRTSLCDNPSLYLPR